LSAAASTDRLSALDALGRGIASVRGNWALVPIAVAGSILTAGVALASVVPLLAAIGLSWSDLGALGGEPAAAARLVEGFDPAALGSARLLGVVLAFLGGLTVASLVAAWFQAGLLGVLAAAGLFGRLLLFWGAALALFLVWMLLLVGYLVGIGVAAGRLGPGAGFSVGCGGAIPLAFLFFALVLGVGVAQADLPRPESSATRALATGFRVLGRRFGACLALWALFLVAMTAVALVDGGLGLASSIGLRGHAVAEATVIGVRLALEALANALATLALTASTIALVRSERARAVPRP
jgi:hypothetical protein